MAIFRKAAPAPTPGPDPFAMRPRAPRDVTRAAIPLESSTRSEVPVADAFPVLAGIATERSPSGSVFTAVLVLTDGSVQLVTEGQIVGPYHIDTIRSDRVMATNSSSNRTLEIELQ